MTVWHPLRFVAMRMKVLSYSKLNPQILSLPRRNLVLCLSRLEAAPQSACIRVIRGKVLPLLLVVGFSQELRAKSRSFLSVFIRLIRVISGKVLFLLERKNAPEESPRNVLF